MKRFALGIFALLITTTTFANSVNCFVDKEITYGNGRPGNDTVIMMEINRFSISSRFLKDAESLVPGIINSIGPETLTATLSLKDQVLASVNVTELLVSGKGNLGSETVVLSSGNRYHLRCEGKSE